MSELEGITIGHCHIQCLLAQGGMSEIYLAQDLLEKCMVAIKIVHNSNREYYERFRHEVQMVSSLHHAHILPVLDYGEYESWYYLVTPYISYGTLGERLAVGKLSLTEAGKILEQLVDALQFAHEQGIIHRDIKPSNVLLHAGDHVYLADFGLAKRIGENRSFTLTGMMMGTPDYMAPELVDEPATTRSDIYALGVLLYQMLTGKLPFRGSTPQVVLSKHISEHPPRPSMYNATISVAMEHVILQALQKDPRKRFKTAADMIDAYRLALTVEPPELLTLAASATVTTFRIRGSRPLSRQKVKLQRLPMQVAISAACLLLLLPLSLSLTYYETQTSASTLPQVNAASLVSAATVLPKTNSRERLARAPVQRSIQSAQLYQPQYNHNWQQDNNKNDDDKHSEDNNVSSSPWNWQNTDDNGNNNGSGGKGKQPKNNKSTGGKAGQHGKKNEQSIGKP